MAYRRLPKVIVQLTGTVRVLHTLRPFTVVMAGGSIRSRIDHRSAIGGKSVAPCRRDLHLTDSNDLSAGQGPLICQGREPLVDQAEQHPTREAAGEQQRFTNPERSVGDQL
jgi:hypothetical protein